MVQNGQIQIRTQKLQQAVGLENHVFRGMASARRPIRVRTQTDRLAPAARNRALSVPVLGSRSALMAMVCSSVWQSQGSPFALQKPWPNWVMLQAVQFRSGSRAIRLATTEVLPTLRECPPTTTTAITRLQITRLWLAASAGP